MKSYSLWLIITQADIYVNHYIRKLGIFHIIGALRLSRILYGGRSVSVVMDARG